MNKEKKFMRLKIFKKNRLFKYYAENELNFGNVTIFTKKVYYGIVWRDTTLDWQSSEIFDWIKKTSMDTSDNNLRLLWGSGIGENLKILTNAGWNGDV